MKHVFALLTALVCAVLLTAAMAESAPAPSPILQLYQAEENLLFCTGDVTMSGHAVFSIDGQVFKTADLLHIQQGTASMRDWRLLTPTPDGNSRETGYTVVTRGNDIHAYESYQHSELMYVVDEAIQRTSILRHTIISMNLNSMAHLLLEHSSDIGSCTAAADENGCTVIDIVISEGDLPPLLDSLLNSVLQYGIDRYAMHDYASEIMIDSTSYSWYNTVTEGLIYCLKSVHLRELSLQAALDQEGRLQRVSGSAALGYTEKSGEVHEITVDLEQSAYDYGMSRVNIDPKTYDHWGSPEDSLPVYRSNPAAEAAQQLLHNLYWAEGSGLLHADPGCPAAEAHVAKVELTPDLLLSCGLCDVCVDASPFPNELGDPSLDAAAGDLMAAMTYNEYYGLNELFWDLDASYGLFSGWTFAQKHYFTAMLPTLALREEERMELYHPSMTPDTRLWDMLCIWSHGLPKPGADAAVIEKATAYVLDKGLLTQEQMTALTMTCDYCTRSSFVYTFAEPWWVVRFRNEKDLSVCEVWINPAMDEIHAVDVQRMASLAHLTLIKRRMTLGEKHLTSEMFAYFTDHPVYDDGQWCCIVDTGYGSYWNVYMLDDDDLTVVSVEANNG